MIGIYDKNDNLITRLVDNAHSYPDVVEVKNRTLDGQWHIQTIGNAATLLRVEAHLKLNEKSILDTIKRNTDSLKVIFDGKYYVGIIDGKVDYERRKFVEHPMFDASFTLLAQGEGDV